MKRMTKTFLRLKSLFLKFLLIDDSPHKIAAGAALGVFWGIMPGEGIGTAIVTATVFRLNRISAMIGVAATNGWSTLFVLPIAIAVGSFLFGTGPGELKSNFIDTYRSGLGHFLTEEAFSGLILPLIAGFLAISLALSLLAYAAAYFFIRSRNGRKSSR